MGNLSDFFASQKEEVMAQRAKEEKEKQDIMAQWAKIAASGDIPKKGWYLRKLPGVGPMNVRVYHNGEMVTAVQKVSFEIDAKYGVPKLKLEILMLSEDQLVLDFDEDEKPAEISAKTSPFPPDRS